ncbi:4Fe-4S dicluster domain-containing protein [Candidatus Bathyarchaeota archaeon]|nr:4Fe-4S dicluster domain-containing protein [Candidatus Bathyarchaeota archaeon]
MLEANRHPNIRTMTYAEVVGFSGFVGNFTVKIRQKARFVTNTCNGCGACVDICPAFRPHDFEYGMAESKAIYKAFAQAVPGIVQIDKNYCIECGLCKTVCELDSIDLEQQDEFIEEDFGVIVVACGFEEYEPSKGTLGYKEFPNVVTQGRLERILAPNGPTVGHLLRPSDGKRPRRIAMIQCVGSRDTRTNEHCCSVGCLLSVKNAKLIKQHYPDSEIYIIYMDMRCTGKASEEYAMMTRMEGVHFIRSNIGRVWEDPETRNLILRFEDTMDPGKLKKLEVDMVVLTANMVLGESGKELASLLRLDHSPDGFLKEFHARLDPISTKVPGIFLAGTCQGPLNIAESISHAKGAASSAGKILKKGKYEIELIKAVVEHPEHCSVCYRCVEACPYDAISIDDEGKINIDLVLCRGCGTCNNVCRSQTIQLRYYRDPGYEGYIDGMLSSQEITDSGTKE